MEQKSDSSKLQFHWEVLQETLRQLKIAVSLGGVTGNLTSLIDVILRQFSRWILADKDTTE